MNGYSVEGFGHVGITVRDLARSRAFYEQHFGFTVVWEYERGGEHLLFMGNRGCVVEFLQSQTDEPPQDGPLNHLSIRVSDVYIAKRELEQSGVVFETEVLHDPHLYPNGELFAMFRGPDNERLQIEQIL